ncbi:AAA family ATPase [Ramlibacter sp. AW1]|uniref:AAA family ATPase n=1 Tax=Ramlibacter aurantiacus TaxID=2801330 RepID=A0A936ZM99_9BURK|nr:AAA family ATPase [Ramlibacter aurantiacus]MBL0419898.1 AAA family ATPase [Ramlibacter aurantiacus]
MAIASGSSQPAPVDVSIRLLGGFALEPARGDTALGRRATQLLELLSLQPQRSLLHDEVVEALWPHLSPGAGSANLRKAAHHARRYVGTPDALVLRGGRVFLLPGRGVDCDAEHFERAADHALSRGDPQACRDALELYRGELLPDARYEPWAEQPRQRLRDKYLRLLRQAGQLERLVQEEPADEAAHLALMEAELAAGRRTAALRWWAHLRDHLQASLGVAPGPRVEALYRRCVDGLEGDVPAFVGRGVELARVLALLSGAGQGAPGGLLLRAPAGMGKTAFCRKLLHEARAAGWRVRLLQADDDTRPHGLTCELVEPLVQEGGRDVLDAIGPHARAILAALTPAAGAATPLALPIGRHQVVGAVRRLLLATSGGQPVLLMVDDAHAADEASAELLAQLASSGPPLFVLLAGRPALPQGLQRQTDRLLRSGVLQALDLPPLSADESALLVQRAAARSLPAASTDAVVRAARGLPFALVELARASHGAPPWPRDISTAIAERLADVEPEAMDALRRLALVGQDFDVATALALAADDGADGARRLDAALGRGVLRVDAGRYAFAHDLLRQALVDGLAPHRQRALRGELATRLSRGGAAPGLVARHWFAADETDRALPFALAAARDGCRLGAFEDVLRHVEPVLAHRPAQPEALVLRAEAMDALARPGTLAAYDAAAAVSPQPLADELRAKRALAQVKMSDPPGALRYLQGVHPTTVAGRLAEALAYSGAAALGFGDPAEGSRRAAEVRRLALETGDQGTLVIASWAQAAAAHARGDLHGSVWADLRETSHLPELAVRVFDGHLCITQRFLYGSRPYADVITFADRLAAEAQRLGAARGHAFAVTLRGEARLLSGQLDAAEQDLVAGGRLHRDIGGATGEALSLQRRAELALLRGRRDVARALLDEALDVARASDVGFHLLDRIYGTRIALAGGPDAALNVLEEAEAAVRGPLETCPGCRITFAIPATIAAARARQPDLAAGHLRLSEYLANVVMKLPAWYAALREARAHVALAAGEVGEARLGFALAARGFAEAGQPLDAARCQGLAGDTLAPVHPG